MDLSAALQEAVGAGDTRQVSLLLSQCPPGAVNAPIDDEGTTLLHLAANSHAPTLTLLLARGAVVNWQNSDGLTALHVAALWGRAEPLRTLLQHGADPAISDIDDLLPVDLAREEGHEDCVALLEDPAHSPPSPPLLEQSMAETFVSMMLCDPSELTSVSALSTTPCSPELWAALGEGERLERRLSYGGSDCSWENGRTRSRGTESPDPLAARGQQMSNVSADSGGLDSSLYTTALDLGEHDDAARGPPPSSPLVDALEASFRRLEVSHSSQDSSGADTTAVTEADRYRQSEGSTLQSSYISQLSHAPLKAPVVTPPTSTPSNDVTIPVPAPDIPPAVAQLTNEQLRSRLVELGEEPGPVNSFTRHAYLNYLTKLLAGVQPSGNKGYKGYRYELALVLNGTAPIPEFSALEQRVFKSLREPRLLPHPPTPRAKDGTAKAHFNYLLLDPRVAEGVLGEEGGGHGLGAFQAFVESVFYVGKGKNARSLQHLRDAKDYKLTQRKRSEKLQCILDIWSSGHGVMSLHLFNNTTAQEAFTREACMIEAIGLNMLTNIQKGHAHGEVAGWPLPRRRHFGVYLLFKAFRAFLLDPPPQIYQGDL